MIFIKQFKDRFLIIALFLSLMFTTVAYASLNTQLNIMGGEAIIRTDKPIRLTGLTLKKGNEMHNSKYEKDAISFLNITLKANESVEYEVEITNKDRITYMIKSINDLVNKSNINPNIEVSSNIKVGDYIVNYSKKTFVIKLTNKTTVEQNMTLVRRYEFEPIVWSPLETKFLSESNTGNLDVNKDGVFFEFEVYNPNTFDVTYNISSNNPRFTLDDTSGKDKFVIKAKETIKHKVLINIRSDVTYEEYEKVNLDLMVHTSYPVISDILVETVILNLPPYFKTIILNSMEIKDSPIRFDSIENSQGFLYRIVDFDAISYTYYYRGVVENNYVEFAGKLWRIVRVDANGNVRIVLNDNADEKVPYASSYDYNTPDIETAKNLLDYRKSDLKKSVDAWYIKNIKSNVESKYVVNSNFCVDLDYQDPMTTPYHEDVVYFNPYTHVGIDAKKYTPDFTCSGNKILKSNVGLLTAEEVLAAGGYWQIANDKYYLYSYGTSWTMSASYYSILEKQAGAITFNQDGFSLFDWVQGGNLAQTYGYRPVIALNGNVYVKGDGTINNPYKIVSAN